MEKSGRFIAFVNGTNLVLWILMIIVIYLILQILPSYFNNQFVINVEDISRRSANINKINYQLTGQTVIAQLIFRSDRFLDYLFTGKDESVNLISLLFFLTTLVQLQRIHWHWKNQEFRYKLLGIINNPPILGTVIFIYASIQSRYLNSLAKKISPNFRYVHDYYLLALCASIVIFGFLLKGFAKRGQNLQELNDFVI